MHNKLILGCNAIMILSGCKENFPAILQITIQERIDITEKFYAQFFVKRYTHSTSSNKTKKCSSTIEILIVRLIIISLSKQWDKQE